MTFTETSNHTGVLQAQVKGLNSSFPRNTKSTHFKKKKNLLSESSQGTREAYIILLSNVTAINLIKIFKNLLTFALQ